MAKLNATFKDKLKDRLKFIKRCPYLLLLLSKKNWIVGKIGMWRYNDEEFVRRLYKIFIGK